MLMSVTVSFNSAMLILGNGTCVRHTIVRILMRCSRIWT